ncbi:MAG TPA: hypothetical protein VD978_26835 [Azospirillum sp.]|nr:hypothetical protein [Azospirillum sp.]
MRRTPVLAAILVLALGPLVPGMAAAADWYTVAAARVRISAQHPAFPGQRPAVSVRMPDDIARTAQSDWLRFGKLSEPGPVFTATYQTQYRRFPSYTLRDSLWHKEAFRAYDVIPLGEGPIVRSDFGPVETMKVAIRKGDMERQCGYWHWQDSDNRSYFDGWYCPPVGQEVTDSDIKRSVWAVRWRTQEARAP